MKQPRHKISNYIAKTTLENGITHNLTSEIAAYLLNDNRISDLDSILRDIRQYWADHGMVEVIAISAFDISTKIHNDIKAEIMKIYPSANKVIVTEQRDPSVIAGVRLELANQQLDLSIQSKLNKFKQLSVS